MQEFRTKSRMRFSLAAGNDFYMNIFREPYSTKFDKFTAGLGILGVLGIGVYISAFLDAEKYRDKQTGEYVY